MKDNEMLRTQKLSPEDLPTKTIPLVCSWCNKIYRIEKWKYEQNQRTGVSHGICKECLKRMEDAAAQGGQPDDESSKS